MVVTTGGGLEDGESLQEAAIREVKEEAGIDVELGDIVCLRQFSFGGDTNNLTVASTVRNSAVRNQCGVPVSSART